MTTFNQLVDELTTELLRPDLRTTIAAYANQTIRELHFRPNGSAPILFDANREEEELTVTTDTTWTWALSYPTRFQDIEAIYNDDLGMYIERRNPRISLRASFEPFSDVFWYRSGSVVAIAGVVTGQKLKASYFLYPQMLAYQAVPVVRYDMATDSYVLIVGGGTPTEAQLAAATHWMLQRWSVVIAEGVRAKVWKRLADSDRARMAFSAFETMRTALWNAEPAS